MKTFLVRLVVIGLLVIAGSATVVADTFPVPICYPTPCGK